MAAKYLLIQIMTIYLGILINMVPMMNTVIRISTQP